MPRLRALLAGFALTTGLISITAPAASAVIPTPAAPSCQITRASGLPLVQLGPRQSIDSTPFVDLTATDSHGLWAGVRFDGVTTYQVIAWRNGVTQVLDSFSFDVLTNYWQVQVLGVTNTQGIIVAVQHLAPAPLSESFYRYQGGRRYDYGRNPSWTALSARSVSVDGHVVGTAGNAQHNYVVEWDPSGRPTVIADAGDNTYETTIDQYDDVIWQQLVPAKNPVAAPVAVAHFRTPAGKIGQLEMDEHDHFLTAGAGRWIWAQHDGELGQNSVSTWDMSQASSSAMIKPQLIPAANFDYPVAGNPNGSFVAGFKGSDSTWALYDAYHDGHRLPSVFSQPVPAFALANDSTMSFTGPDGLVRFIRCPLNYAKHNPRGVIYHGAVVNGQTLITGGSFDSDDATGHDLVYIFDQTTSVRRLLATVTADQYDPSFSQAYGISGNHRYRYTFPTVPGRHTYCAYGRNVGYGNQNTLLGCTTVTA